MKLCSEGKFIEATEPSTPPISSAWKLARLPDSRANQKALPPSRRRANGGLLTTRSTRKVEGPLVADSHFAVTFKMDVTFKPQSKRFTMEEVAVYKVADGKIVYEEFFYNM